MGNVDVDIDYSQVIDYILKKYNNPSLYGIGISMGAGALSQCAGKLGKKLKLKALVIMACPFDFNIVTKGLKL